MCYVKFHPGGLATGFNLGYKFDSVVQENKNDLYNYVNRRQNNKTAALVDGIEIKCPKMYLLSDNKKLCYFLAKYRDLEHSDYLALLVNKTTAVTFCNSFSNGTLPYGKFFFN